MAPYSSTLAWKIPMTEEAGGPQSMRSLRVGYSSGGVGNGGGGMGGGGRGVTPLVPDSSPRLFCTHTRERSLQGGSRLHAPNSLPKGRVPSQVPGRLWHHHQDGRQVGQGTGSGHDPVAEQTAAVPCPPDPTADAHSLGTPSPTLGHCLPTLLFRTHTHGEGQASSTPASRPPSRGWGALGRPAFVL